MKELNALGKTKPILPTKDGHWEDPGKKGNSAWIFDLDRPVPDISKDTPKPPKVPWRDIIKKSEYPDADRVPFKDGFPVFDDYTVSVTSDKKEKEARFVFPTGKTLTTNRRKNFSEADKWVASEMDCDETDVQDLRRKKKLTWHEKESEKEMILVPRAIHGFVPHSGGVSAKKSGGAGSERGEVPAQQEIGGESLYRVEDLNLWRRVKASGDNAGPELTVTYVCADPEAGPTPAQQEKEQKLLENWTNLSQTAQELLAQYVSEEWPEAAGAWSVQATELIIYPDELWGEILAGILWDFSLDPEHGLGICIFGDGSMEAGDGDIAL